MEFFGGQIMALFLFALNEPSDLVIFRGAPPAPAMHQGLISLEMYRFTFLSLSQKPNANKTQRKQEESSIPCLALRQNFCFCCSRTTMSSSEYNNDEVVRNFFTVDMDKFIKFYLSWAFRTSYLKLILNFSMSYFAFIMAFAGMYYGISKQWPMCINSGGGEMVVGPSAFEDCFQLSWETFSTVVSGRKRHQNGGIVIGGGPKRCGFLLASNAAAKK